MKIADQRNSAIQRIQPLTNRRNGGSRFRAIHGNANQLRTGLRQRGNLLYRGVDVHGIGIGHRLHDDRRRTADHDVADPNLSRAAPVGAERVNWHHIGKTYCSILKRAMLP